MTQMLTLYLEGLRQYPQLKHEDLVALFVELEDPKTKPARAKRIRDKLTEANLRLVVSCAKMYKSSNLPLEDLIQEGNIGLMKAITRFDHRKGFRFSTYATWWIKQGIQQFTTKNKRVVRLPAHAAHLQKRLIQETEKFRDDNDCEPTAEELQQLVGASSTVMKATMNASHGIVSLQDYHKGSMSQGGGVEPRTYEHTIKDESPHADPFSNVSSEEAKEMIRQVIFDLGPKEVAILRLRFGLLPGVDEAHEYEITEDELEQVASGEGLT